MSGNIPQIPAPVTADPGFWKQGIEGLNALRDQQAKQASADAYRQSMNPDGTVNTPKYNALIAGGPGAWNAGPLMQQQGQAQEAQARGSAEQVSGRLAQLKVMSSEMSDLLQSGQPITADQIHARLNSLGQEGILTPAAMNGINADLNSQPPGADLTQWLRNHYATGLSASDALKNVTSQPQTVDQGDRKIVVEGNPNMPGGRRVGSVYTQGQAPPALGTTVMIHYPDGHDEQVTPDQVQERLGGNPGSFVISPGGGGGGGGGAPGLNAAGDSATRKAAEGGPPVPNTPAAAVAQRTHDFWISQGYNEAQVAGILAGGPGSESDFTPTAKGDGGTSYGQYQHHGERLAAMQKYFNLPAGQMPTEQQQNQYAAWEISPQGPLAHVGAALKLAKTPAEAATIWTRDFGVPADKSEIARRANGAQRFVGLYGQPQGQPPAASTPPPAAPVGAPQSTATVGRPGGPALQSGGAPAIAAAPAAPAVAPQPVAQPPAPAPMRAGVTPSLGAGERVKADIDAYTKDAGAVGIHQNNINTLQNAYRALQLADTGPGTQNLQAARAFLQSFGIATSATGDQATQWAEAHKYLMDYARTQGGLGGTDLQLLASKESNASTDIPKPAALAVVRNNIARERMAMAQVQEASGSAGYVDHTKTFLPSQDLRAYQADIMPPQELKQIEALQKTNPKAFEKFQKSLDIARAHGFISDEDLAAQNQRIRALGP